MKGFPALCDGLVRWGLVALIGFTPFAFGTVEPWSILLMEWSIITLLLLHAARRAWDISLERPRRRRTTGLEGPLVAFLVLGAAQTIPMPLTWIERLSPGSAVSYRPMDLRAATEAERTGVTAGLGADPLLDATPPGRRPVSLNPGETWSRVRLVASLAALFFLVVGWVDRVDRVVFLVRSVTIAGFLVAVQGLVQYLTWNGKILWIRKVPPSAAFGPFVNHNHFAGYIGMVIPLALSFAVYIVGDQRKIDESAAVGDLSTRDRARIGDSTVVGRWSRGVLVLFATVILVVALLLSLSRGGLVSMLTGSGLLVSMLARRRGLPFRAWAVAGVLVLLVVGLVAWIGAGTVTKRIRTLGTFESEGTLRYRMVVWRSVIQHVPEYLWVGSGLGTFESSFAPYLPPGSTKRWDKAHNDYLQLLWESGVVGSAIVLIAGVIFIRRYWWPGARGFRDPVGLLGTGMAAALLTIGLHSLVDFNLQIGANAFLCVLVGGLLVALSRIPGVAPARISAFIERPGSGR